MISSLKVSAFCNIWDTENANYRKNYEPDYLIGIIRQSGNKVSNLVNEIRATTDNLVKSKLKSNLPVILWQGSFCHRSAKGYSALSSLVCIDIDHQRQEDIDVIRRTVSGWPFVYACFLSPSGDGLKVLVKTDNYDPNLYTNCYRQVEQIFISAFGIKPDSACEDISHGCYASYDPMAYHNPNPTDWHFVYNPEFDKTKLSSPNNSRGEYVAPTLTASELFMAKLNAARSPLSDEQILKILDLKFHNYPKNYEDGNRTKSIFVQARTLCLAGIEENNAIDYLKEQFIPTGLSADKVIREAKNAYSKTIDLFGTERCKYKTYSEYKKSH